MSEDSPKVPGGFAAGSRMAGYLLEEQIGQGGMAVVFRAHDERLDRTVALKILAPALADDQAFRQRFIRESRAAAAVDDPHIIPVFEAGEASGVLFIAMRYVRGGDARSLLTRTGPLPTGRVAEIVSQVASALDAAHARGLVHRDVKPANILLDASGGISRPDHVYLSDFGLSKAALQSSGLTGTGTFLGTLDYVAPEQIEGKPVDGRADEYALACAAFELLAGTPPFARNEAMAVMYAQLSEPPPSLSVRRTDLPAAVDAVFYRAMAKAPADRYRTCREFAEALRKACGLRPYDSGPSAVPTDHPATQVAWSGERTKLAEATAGGAQAGGAPDETKLAGAAASDSGSTARASRPGADVSGEATQAIFAQGGADRGPTAAQPQGPSDVYQGGRRRPRWRSPGALVGALVIVAALGAGGAYAALHGKGGGHGGGGHGTGGHGGHGGHGLPVGGLAAPGCSQTPATASFVSGAQTAYPVANGNPFGVVVSPDSKFVFATTATTLEVFSTGTGLTLTHLWSFTIATPALPAAGVTITPNGQDLLVAAGNGIDVLSLETAETDSGTLVLGTMTVPGISGYGRAINLAVSHDGIYAFLVLQNTGQLAVFNLGNAVTNGAFSSAYMGSVQLGGQAVGVALSPDGKWLYAASFAKHQPSAGEGTLSVVDVAQLEGKNPAQAKVTQVMAGCSPARVVVSPDGRVVWVSARDSDFLLGFSAALLRSDPNKALIVKVQVGQSPIGLALVNGGTKMVIADTDVRHTGANSLAIVNLTTAMAGKSGALLGYLHSGLLPREIAIVPGGMFVVVSDNGGAQLEVINVSKLP